MSAYFRLGKFSLPLVVALAAACGPKDTAQRGASGGRTPAGVGAEDFDIRGVIETTLERPAIQLSTSRQQTLDALGKAAPGAFVVRYSELTNAPSRLSRLGPALTRATSAPARQIARDFVRSYRNIFDLSAADLGESRIARDLLSRHNGARHFTFQFEAQGIDVFGSVLSVNLDAEGRVINVSGQPIPSAGSYTNGASPMLGEADAVKRAAEATHVEEVASSRLLGLVYFPLSATELRLAHNLTFHDADSPNVYQALIDAEDGRLLWRRSLTHYNHLPTHGAVYTSDSPIPNTPQGTSTGTVARVDSSFTGVLVFPHDDEHYDWWADGARTTTTSNNVDAYADRDGDNAADSGSRPTAGGGEDFTFALDLTDEPEDYQDAAVVNLFYWNNRIHDFFYDLGFDEAAGNFQTTNFSFSGSGGDAVRAEAQDNADGDPRSLCNANMSTEGDGLPPRMQMYLCDSASPERDGDLEAVVIGHEYTHGVHTRLVGTSGSQRPNEGWCDYFGLSLVADPTDPYDGKYGVGDYLFNLGGQGIRSFPYSTDTSVFALSYSSLNTSSSCVVRTCTSDDTETCAEDADCSNGGDTCDARACQFHEDCEPPNTTISQGPCRTQVHFAGSIWANTILLAQRNLIAKYGFEPGRRTMNQLVIDGMKLSDDSPTFLDSRNKILEADEVNYGGKHSCLIWDAFAKMGMGYSAKTTGVDDINPVEAFDLPSFCSPVLQVNAPSSFGQVCAGDAAANLLELFNTGAGDLIVTKVETISGSGDISVAADPKLPVFIGPDSHVDFTVTCAPTATGLATATVRITSNDAATPTKDIVYTCNRGVADINVALAGSGDFGGVCAADHADLDVTLFNQGTCDLSITAVSMVPGAGSFDLPDDLDVPLVLGPGSDFRLPLRFAPNACFETAENRTLRISSSDPDESIVNIPVSGTSPCADINVAIADSGDFGAVCAGGHADLDVTLFNQGRCDLVIEDIELIPDTGSFELPDSLGLPLVLSHDADFGLPVRFSPEVCSNTPEAAILRLTTSDPDEPTVDLELSGVAPCGELVIDPPNLDGLFAFPATVADEDPILACFSDQRVNLRNAGGCPLTIDSIEAAGTSNALDFSVMEPTVFPILLPPGEETLGVTVRFTPQLDLTPVAPAELFGELVVLSDDPDGASTADLCGEPVTGSGARILVTQTSSGAPVPVDSVDRITLVSSGVSQPGPINLTFTNQALNQATVCGRTVKYHVDQETLPTAETTGNNPNSSYEASAKEGSLQTTAQFSLGKCEFKDVQLELRDPGGTCVLLPPGAACTTDGQCCSGQCQGPNNNKKCN